MTWLKHFAISAATVIVVMGIAQRVAFLKKIVDPD
jgi:hypothetical protein